MAWLAAALPYASAAASVGNAIGQGKAQEQIAEIQAKQLEKQGIADTAQAVQTAKHERLKADHLQSRVRALAAKSGASLSSTDIQNTLSDIDEQGEYNALAALYSGSTSSQSKKFAAKVARSQGAQSSAGGYARAAGTILDQVQNYA